MEKHEYIIKQNTRILTPKEYLQFREQLNPVYQIIADVLIYSGMRIEEFWVFMKNPQFYKASRRCISISSAKTKCRIKERDILLNQKGCDAVELCLKLKPKRMDRHAMNQAFKLAASKSIGTEGVSPKMFRKTCVSILAKLYPEKLMYISISMGHTLEVMRDHYLGISFTREDTEDMRDFFKGWGE